MSAGVGLAAAGSGAGAAEVTMPCGGEQTEGRLVAVEAGPTLRVETATGDIGVRLAGLVLPPDPATAIAMLEGFVGDAVVVAVTDGRRDRRGRVAGQVFVDEGLGGDDMPDQRLAVTQRYPEGPTAAPATAVPASLDPASLAATSASPPAEPPAEVVVIERGADGGASWLQARLLAAGAAIAGTGLGPATCAAALIAAEDAGRSAAAGLWSGFGNGHVADTQPAGTAAAGGRRAGGTATDRDAAGAWPLHDAAAAGLVDLAPNFAIVRGEVVSVGSAGGRFYLNFGRDWSRDTTVELDRTAAAAIASRSPAAADGAASGTGDETGGDIRSALTARLAGRIVEVRGWLERRDGPYMRVTDGDALRFAD